ncbi:unnamed protein product [Lupinus luteus]|uniref:Uncharacterized protein n=1 Tax=Lupinus luteus TaxID=3873 RepID=A0AAV1WGE7_LUPLU
MRKEHQNAFQEKQKLNQGKNKDAFDISSLVDENDKRLVKRNESTEPHVILSALSADSEKSSLAHIASTSRPLVPLGFASTLLERNLGVKLSTNNHAIEELQLVGAPLSVQRSSVESAGPDISDSIMSLFPGSDNGLPHAGKHAPERHGSGMPSERTHQWLGFNDP